MDLLDIAARAIGVFYFVGGIFVIRQMAFSELLDHVTRAISLERRQPKDRIKLWLLGAGAVMTSGGGAALAAMSAWALPIFAINLLSQLVWLVWARLAFPVEDDEDRLGRDRTRNAAILYAAILAGVAALWSGGRLASFDNVAAAAVALVGLVGAAVYALYSLSRTPRSGWSSEDGTDWKAEAREREEAEKLAADPDYRHPARIRFEVHPHRYPMVDADDGRRLNHFTYMEIEDADDIEAWHDEYVNYVIARQPGAATVFPSEDAENAHREQAEGFVRLLKTIYGRDNVEGPVYLPLDMPDEEYPLEAR